MVEEEAAGLAGRVAPMWRLAFAPEWTDESVLARRSGKRKVAVIREEGSNGDREMAAAVHAAGAKVLFLWS